MKDKESIMDTETGTYHLWDDWAACLVSDQLGHPEDLKAYMSILKQIKMESKGVILGLKVEKRYRQWPFLIHQIPVALHSLCFQESDIG